MSKAQRPTSPVSASLHQNGAVVVDGLRKKYPRPSRRTPQVLAVDGVSFSVDQGTMFTLLGPSGCGKTTTLRCIAGLERPDAGEITVRGRTLVSTRSRINVPANERGLGMVFQSYAIWPHLNVFQNVAFPLLVLPRTRRPSRRSIRERVERVLEVVQLHHLLDRPATHLSGGQQQRLALARALVAEPMLLLLDEPLSNLDAQLREQMRFELKRLQRELGITSVYVTHDQIEALMMSRHIAVMNEGRIEQIGRPREIYDRPQTRFVASFVGVSNLLDGVIDGKRNGVYVVTTEHGEMTVASEAAFTTGTPVTVAVRPERIQILEDSGGHGGWRGVVTTRAFVGDSVDHIVRIGTSDLRVRCGPAISIPPGREVRLEFSGETASLLTRI